MNRSRIVITFVLALLIAGLASVLVMKQLNRGRVRANVLVQRVVMASKDLDVGARLTEEDLRLADWAVGEPPKGVSSRYRMPSAARSSTPHSRTKSFWAAAWPRPTRARVCRR